MLTLLYLFLSRTEVNKESGIVLFFIDIVLLAALCFVIGYFCPISTCIYLAVILLAVCLPAPYYHEYREKIRLELLPPLGSPNKAYLDFQIAFDRRTPWRMYGDMFFDLFCPKSFLFFATVIAIGKFVAYFVR